MTGTCRYCSLGVLVLTVPVRRSLEGVRRSIDSIRNGVRVGVQRHECCFERTAVPGRRDAERPGPGLAARPACVRFVSSQGELTFSLTIKGG